jgi:TonB family protein
METPTEIKSPLSPIKRTSESLLVIKLSSDPSAAPFKLDKERIVIGSVVSADVRLMGDGVAPIHAVLENQRGKVTLYDLASDSGVFVNGKKIVTQVIQPSDEVIIGHHKFKYTLEVLPATASGAASAAADFTPLMSDDGTMREIFDYRPTHKTALEVIMSWHDSVLLVEHFVEGKRVTLGDPKENGFIAPITLNGGVYELLSRAGDQFALNLTREMRGVIQKDGALIQLQGQPSVMLGQHDFAKVALGDIDFYISFTAAPPRLKPARWFERDPLFFKIFVASLLFTAVAVTGLMSAKVPQTIDAEQIPDRIATILYQPEKYSYQHDTSPEAVNPPPVATPTTAPTAQPTVHVELNPSATHPKPVPKEMEIKQAKQGSKTKPSNVSQLRSKEGKGARAKGTEGTRGKQNARADQEHQTKAARPAPNAGKGAGGGESQVADQGNVDLLKDASAKIQDLIGSSTQHLGKGGQSLRGFGGFDTLGNGGLALSGTGKGGGGNAASLGGLSDKGKGGGKIGTGAGATGTGNGIAGGQTRVVLRTGNPEENVVMGSIDQDAIWAAILAHKDEFRLCYEREINAENPNIAGTVVTSFTIGQSGKVDEAGVAKSSVNNVNVERCVLGVLRRIQFPIPRGAGVVEVKAPFKFSAGAH